MLWDEKVTKLPDNFRLAKKRFQYLRKRLVANPDLLEMYEKVIKEYVTKGYARRMLKSEAAIVTPRTWYLPHHPVLNPNKPGKVRVVKDAAATYDGVSLNSSLKTGPDLMNSLVGVILRFRSGKIAIAADIEGMFHQVRVPEADRDSLRFLWSDKMDSGDDPFVMQMNVHIFGAKDSPTCANFALKQTARDNQHKFDALTFETALRAFYVDDLLKSVNSVEVATSLALELIDMMKCGSFRLTKFVSNSNEVINALPASEVSPSITFNIDTENTLRALGISWEVKSDRFTFQINLPDSPHSKRGVLRVTCSLFDPMGFLMPFIPIAKILLQELWRRGYGWNDPIDDESTAYWQKWLDVAKNVTNVYIDRCYFDIISNPIVEVQLHIFNDASELAYGSVGYFRFTLKAGGYACRFIMSKSKLAPIKTVTLPRLELNAAVTGVRM